MYSMIMHSICSTYFCKVAAPRHTKSPNSTEILSASATALKLHPSHPLFKPKHSHPLLANHHLLKLHPNRPSFRPKYIILCLDIIPAQNPIPIISHSDPNAVILCMDTTPIKFHPSHPLSRHQMHSSSAWTPPQSSSAHIR